jgi:hypothetical protein
MNHQSRKGNLPTWTTVMLLWAAVLPTLAGGQTITPSPYWENEITFPYDRFSSLGPSKESVKWVKFTILQEPYDPNLVYFQDSRKYVFHYTFATEVLDPFKGMSTQQFNAVTLFKENQQAILGTVILPPATGWPAAPLFPEYGIQFVRQDPFTREQIRDLFNLVRSKIAAPPEVQAFYFPTYEQQAAAAADRDWFEAQGIPLSSTARWAQGNTCYSPGWALGTLKFFPGDRIADSYHSGLLGPNDILLTDGVPAEVPYVAGIISLAPSTPNSHVAILARAYGVPFVYLALAHDAERAQQLVGHRIIFSVYDDYGTSETQLRDTDTLLDETAVAQILELKRPTPLVISAMTPYGAVGVSTEQLLPSDIKYVGGKASNFGILRRAVPDNSPKAIALTFDLWNAFLDQPLAAAGPILLEPGQYLLFWADDDPEQGPTHTSFQLSKGGESVALFDIDGQTLIDAVHFGPQTTDVSYGRSVDGGDTWQSFPAPTPGRPTAPGSGPKGRGLVINEIMADNRRTIPDPCSAGGYPDWIELYNASDETITLNGMYLTDDVNEPTKWQIRPIVQAPTLREEIARRLSGYTSYPPPDMQSLSRELLSIRSLFTNPAVAHFSDALRDAVIAVLTDPSEGFDPQVTLRFRSSTNVEDSADFVGAGMYDSFSGCLADDLDDDSGGPCGCDPNKQGEHGVFETIARVFASFYNDNAYLERLRHDVNEAQVGMAMLVHPSFPDEIELANGVATVQKKGADTNTEITLVTQQGAVSVTNPADGSTPEEVTVTILPSGSIVPPKLKQPSSLLPLGGTVMAWTKDYTDLTNLLLLASGEFSEVTGQTSYMLDLEYKKVAPGSPTLPAGGLVLKQIRQVPTPDQTPSITPFLLNLPLELEVFPGEVEVLEKIDVFADHRLKSRWTLAARNMPLDANHLDESLYSQVYLEYVDDGRIRMTTEEMSLLPQASHSFDGQAVADAWRLPDAGNPRAYRLRTTGIPTAVSQAQNPLLTLADLGAGAFNLPYKCLTLDVEYDQPVMSWRQHVWSADPPSGLYMTTKDRVHLWSCPPAGPADVLQERAFAAGGISIQTSFYYPPPPVGFTDWTAHTAPLVRWGPTTIEGLTAEPIVLEGYYSRTYRPEHHNLIEHFLFEPRLEPNLSPALLEQLRELNVWLIHLILDNRPDPDSDQSQIQTYGFEE